jgi:multiple sugar transport system ATP-binding protein
MTLGTRVAVISGGVLQQIAAPQELYRRPANLFVAGFIGSPAMNLIDARLERGGAEGSAPGFGEASRTDASGADSGPVVVFGPHRLKIPPQVVHGHPALEQQLGADIVLGIRPEHLRDAALAPDGHGAPVVELPIRLREELGSEVHLHAAIGMAAHVSDGAAIAVDAAELQFFDPAAGQGLRR